LIVYTPQIERGYTPDTIVNDHKFDGGPSNSSGKYYGKVKLRFAVAQSLNTVAWQLYEDLTPAVGLQYLKNMNFSAIVDSDYIPATSLGGFTKGVSAVEMASAYATLENDGLYREPTCIKYIVDSDENIVYTSEMKEITIYQSDAARTMTDILTTVMDSGTGKTLKLTDMPCAGKTGTTNDHKDGWFCGYTRYYTTCVWVGCDYPKAISDLSGSTYPGQIWKKYMSAIHEGLATMEFLPYAKLSDDFLQQQEEQEEEQEEELDEDDGDADEGGNIDDQDNNEGDHNDPAAVVPDNGNNNSNNNNNNNSNEGDNNNGGNDNPQDSPGDDGDIDAEDVQ
jgi:membrane peptidoglycan carboxypeptidase